MKEIIFAIMYTEYYEFTVFGESEESCKNAIFNEWIHGNGSEYREKFSNPNELEDFYGICYYSTKEQPIGVCKRG